MPRLILERGDAVLKLAATFRRHGYEGASLSLIQTETGIGRGSLYHFFPDGKADMARAVLEEAQNWFEREVYAPLRAVGDPVRQITAMVAAVETYFVSREMTCLFAVMTLSGEHTAFAEALRAYFADWIGVLTKLLDRAGATNPHADAIDAVLTIQGALLVARALDASDLLTPALQRVRDRLTDAVLSMEGADR